MKTDVYHYTESGLDYVYLLDGYTVHETPYGKGVSFDDDLDAYLAEIIIKEKPLLEGQDIRFLRSLMRISQTRLGRLLGVTRDAIAKKEKSHDKTLPATMDRLLRLWYTKYANDTGVRDVFDRQEALDEAVEVERISVQKDTNGDWELVSIAA